MNATTSLPPHSEDIHGTYRLGQWTCHPDQVVLVVGGGVGTVGGGGKRVSSIAVTFIITVFSMCAGFRQSNDIT